MKRSTRRWLPALAAIALVAALLPSAASASSYKKDLAGALATAIGSAGTACDDATLSQPFATWGDAAQYKLAPGGNFEADSIGWNLAGGATVEAGNEPFSIGGSADASSLSLPPGASASSPASCVTIAYPTFRFFAGAQKRAKVDVDVVYDRYTFDAGVVKVADWAPSRLLLTGAVGPRATHMSIRITNVSNETVQIDDVYIDPYRRS